MVSRPRVDRPEDDIAKFFRRVDRTEVTAALRSSSVHNGRTRYSGEDSLLVDGSAIVTGILRVIGRLIVEGLGILDVAALINLTGMLRVLAGGKIVVSGGESPATLEDGALSFETGGRLEADTTLGGARLRAGDAVVNVGDVASIRKGSSSVIVTAAGITIHPASGNPITLDGEVEIPLAYIPTIVDPTQPEGTLRVTPSGALRRSVIA